MKATIKAMAILLIALMLVPTLVHAQGEKVETQPAGKKEVVKLKYKNIQDEIDGSFDFLADIGEMIDNARQSKNGHSLMAAVLLLEYAEKIAKKKSAIITSDALINEVGELAAEQKNTKLAKSLNDYYTKTGNKTKADEYAKLAKEFEAVAGAARGYGWVKIENQSSYFVDVYIDGWEKGRLYSGYYAYYKVWEGETKLYAEAPYTEPYNWFWGPKWVDLYEDDIYTWTITD